MKTTGKPINKQWIGVAGLILVLTAGGFVGDRLLAFGRIPLADFQLENLRVLSGTSSEHVQQRQEKLKEKIKTFQEKNLFVPPPSKPSPPTPAGVLGDEAFINGKWYKVGDTVDGAKILSVGPNGIEIEWEGKTMPRSMSNASSSRSSGPGPRRPDRSGPPPGATASPQPEQAGPPDSSERGPGGRGRFRDLSPEEREAMRQRFRDNSNGDRPRGRGGPRGPRQE